MRILGEATKTLIETQLRSPNNQKAVGSEATRAKAIESFPFFHLDRNHPSPMSDD
jgi:hypothetical protein